MMVSPFDIPAPEFRSSVSRLFGHPQSSSVSSKEISSFTASRTRLIICRSLSNSVTTPSLKQNPFALRDEGVLRGTTLFDESAVHRLSAIGYLPSANLVELRGLEPLTS
jgi:hypothetical protein